MKTTAQTASSSKADVMKNVKSAKRKIATAAKRGSRTASKLTSGSRKTAEGYSEQGQRLIRRGKAAFLDASAWAGEKASALPKAARDLNLPDQKAMQTLMQEKPLFVGAVGLGVGVVIGALLPSMAPRAKAKPSRRK